MVYTFSGAKNCFHPLEAIFRLKNLLVLPVSVRSSESKLGEDGRSASPLSTVQLEYHFKRGAAKRAHTNWLFQNLDLSLMST